MTHGFALPAEQGICTKREIAKGGPKGKCLDRRAFTFHLHARRGDRVVSVRAYVNKRLVARKRGRNLKVLRLKRLPLGKFKVTIITRTAKGHSTKSVRFYKGCRKSRPRVTHPS